MKLYNDPSRGIVFNPNWPVEPEYCTDVDDLEFRKFNSQVEWYNSALQTAIGEAIPFEEQKNIGIRIHLHYTKDLTFEFKPATFYEVPDMKLELVWEECDCSCDTSMCTHNRQLYRIVSEPKQEPKVETQEDNKAVIDFAVWYSGMERQKVVTAYQRYEREVLTRKQS